MGKLSMMEKGKPVACHQDWPLFYMNDFSRLGLVVSHLAEALNVLKHGGFTVHEVDDMASVDVAEHRQVLGIVGMLRQHGLSCELTDTISCAYQG